MSVNRLPIIAQFYNAPMIEFFEPGFRLINGDDLNTLFSILFYVTGINKGIKVITSAAAPITITNENIVVMLLAAPVAASFTLPSVLTRISAPLQVYDWNGNAGDMTFTPSGAEKIGGVAGPWKVGSGGVPGSGGYLQLTPLDDPTDALVGWVPST